MRAVGPQAWLDARGGLAIAVGDEVIGGPACHGVVRLEVAVRHHMVVVALEQRHLCATYPRTPSALQPETAYWGCSRLRAGHAEPQPGEGGERYKAFWQRRI